MADLNQLARMARLFGAIVPGHGRQAAGRASSRSGWPRSSTTASSATRSAAFAAAYAGDPRDRRPRRGRRRRHGARVRVDGGHAAVARSSPTAPRRSATAPGRATCASSSPPGPAPGCCTPTRTRATSGCSPDGRLGVLDFGAVARLPGRAAAADRAAAALGAGRRRRDASRSGLRDEGFIQPGVRGRRRSRC